MEIGMDDFVSKPFAEETIALLIEKYLVRNQTVNEIVNKLSVNEQLLHFDFSKVKKHLGNNQALVNQFFGLTKTELNKSMLILEEAVINKDLQQLRNTGHKLKGTALTASLNALSNIVIKYSEMTSFDQQIAEKILVDLKRETELVLVLINKLGL